MINQKQIQSSIKSLLKQMAQVEDQEIGYEQFSAGLSQIVVDAIKSATVTVTAGIPVSVVGTGGTSTGVTTNTGTGNLT